MLSIYKIVIRLARQVLSREDSKLLADRHAIRFCCSSSEPLEHWTGTLTPELPGWSKVTTSYFLCVDHFGLF